MIQSIACHKPSHPQQGFSPKYILVHLLGEKSIELKKAILFPGLSDDVFLIEALEKTVETKTPQGVKVHE